jgi:hypothetical protein
MIKSVSDFSFHTIGGAAPAEMATEVMKIWTESAGLDQAEAERRLGELILVVKAESGQVIGISTAVKTYIQQIQNYVYVYRCFILPEFRAPALDTQMIVLSKKHLHQISKTETDKKSVGLMVIVQNELLKKNWRQAVWRGADMIYMGDTPTGDHMRIGYFNGARI